MINRGSRSNLIPDNVEFLKSDKNDLKKIRHLLGERRFDAVMDYLCYSDDEVADSFNFYSHYTKQYFFISSCAVYNTTLGEVCREDSPKILPIWSYKLIVTVKLHGSSIWNFIGTFFKNIFNGCRDYVNMVPDKITLAASQC